jgi:hypothetical protein
MAFLKAILANKKKALHQSKVKLMEVPKFPELSVKSMFEEAIRDPEVGIYLPDFEMNSKKFPEREFFFGVLASLRPDYLKQVIDIAH